MIEVTRSLCLIEEEAPHTRIGLLIGTRFPGPHLDRYLPLDKRVMPPLYTMSWAPRPATPRTVYLSIFPGIRSLLMAA